MIEELYSRVLYTLKKVKGIKPKEKLKLNIIFINSQKTKSGEFWKILNNFLIKNEINTDLWQ